MCIPNSLAFLLLAVMTLAVTSLQADDSMEKAKKCAEDLPLLYDELCSKVKGDGAQVVEIKKKCIEYPPKLAAQKEVVEEFEKCNVAKDVCNKEVMKKCGENHFTIADKKYQESKTKDPKAANLAELAMNDMESVYELCEKSKACIKAEIGVK